MNYNLQFEKLCKTVALGKIITPPQELSGGLMHRMFALASTSGKYAVKALPIGFAFCGYKAGYGKGWAGLLVKAV